MDKRVEAFLQRLVETAEDMTPEEVAGLVSRASRLDDAPGELVVGPDRIQLELFRLALTAIARDDALECRCGEPPYGNGAYCPKCTACLALRGARPSGGPGGVFR